VAVTTDILALWRQPRSTFRARLEEVPREDRAFAVLMGACGLTFVAQWPALARAAHLDPAVPLDARMGGALMATLFMLPLIAYGLAALSHLAARVLGGRGSFHGARLALFWALLGAMPGVLFYGLAAGLAGPGPALTLTGVAVFAGFLWLWLTLLAEAEREPGAWT
jgi:hypothetical protein